MNAEKFANKLDASVKEKVLAYDERENSCVFHVRGKAPLTIDRHDIEDSPLLAMEDVREYVGP